MAEYMGVEVIIPENDQPHIEYLQNAGNGKLTVQRCTNCGELRYPVMTGCPNPSCDSQQSEWQELSGNGTIHSYFIVTQAISPAFRDWIPYPVALIELDEGRDQRKDEDVSYSEGRALRMLANILDADGNPEQEENVAIGKRVEVTFTELGDGWALPQFTLSDEPPSSSRGSSPPEHLTPRSARRRGCQ